MDVVTVLRAASKAVEEAGIVDPLLRPVAFGKAIDLIVGFDSSFSEDRTGGLKGASAETDTLVDAIARRLKLDPSIVSDIYRSDDGRITLLVHSSQLSGSMAQATKEVALLWLAGRMAVNGASSVPVDEVRDESKRIGVHDPKNFAATMKQLGPGFHQDGPQGKKSLSLKRQGWDMAAELVKKISYGGNSA